jgi:hypothetical protein
VIRLIQNPGAAMKRCLADNLLPALSFLFLALTLWSCNPPHSDTDLFFTLQAACQGQASPCTVKLAEVATDFEWDRVAFVKMQAWASNPASALGIDALKMDEFEDLIVFADGPKATWIIRRAYDPEMPWNETVFLDFGTDRSLWRIFEKADAVFGVNILQTGAIQNIDLIPTTR